MRTNITTQQAIAKMHTGKLRPGLKNFMSKVKKGILKVGETPGDLYNLFIKKFK